MRKVSTPYGVLKARPLLQSVRAYDSYYVRVWSLFFLEAWL